MLCPLLILTLLSITDTLIRLLVDGDKTELLLKIGKVIQVQGIDEDNLNVALHKAVEQSAYAKILYLVNSGANVNSKVYGGKSFFGRTGILQQHPGWGKLFFNLPHLPRHPPSPLCLFSRCVVCVYACLYIHIYIYIPTHCICRCDCTYPCLHVLVM